MYVVAHKFIFRFLCIYTYNCTYLNIFLLTFLIKKKYRKCLENGFTACCILLNKPVKSIDRFDFIKNTFQRHDGEELLHTTSITYYSIHCCIRKLK